MRAQLQRVEQEYAAMQAQLEATQSNSPSKAEVAEDIRGAGGAGYGQEEQGEEEEEEMEDEALFAALMSGEGPPQRRAPQQARAQRPQVEADEQFEDEDEEDDEELFAALMSAEGPPQRRASQQARPGPAPEEEQEEEVGSSIDEDAELERLKKKLAALDAARQSGALGEEHYMAARERLVEEAEGFQRRLQQ